MKRLRLNVLLAFAQGSLGVFFAEGGQEGFDFGDESLGAADLFAGVGLGNFTCIEALELAALKEPATHGPLIVNAAGAFRMGWARLEQDALTFLLPDPEAEGGELADGIVTEDTHVVKEHTIAAQAALRAEGFCGR